MIKYYNSIEATGGGEQENIAEIAVKYCVAAGNTANAISILKAMRAYADQEVRKAEMNLMNYLSANHFINSDDDAADMYAIYLEEKLKQQP